MRRKGDFERLLRKGTRRHAGGFTFFLERRESGGPRLGILVSKRHAARATDRNRIKRCIREAFRLEQENLGSVDVLVRPPYERVPASGTMRRLRQLLANLKSS